MPSSSMRPLIFPWLLTGEYSFPVSINSYVWFNYLIPQVTLTPRAASLFFFHWLHTSPLQNYFKFSIFKKWQTFSKDNWERQYPPWENIGVPQTGSPKTTPFPSPPALPSILFTTPNLPFSSREFLIYPLNPSCHTPSTHPSDLSLFIPTLHLPVVTRALRIPSPN